MKSFPTVHTFARVAETSRIILACFNIEMQLDIASEVIGLRSRDVREITAVAPTASLWGRYCWRLVGTGAISSCEKTGLFYQLIHGRLYRGSVALAAACKVSCCFSSTFMCGSLSRVIVAAATFGPAGPLD